MEINIFKHTFCYFEQTVYIRVFLVYNFTSENPGKDSDQADQVFSHMTLNFSPCLLMIRFRLEQDLRRGAHVSSCHALTLTLIYWMAAIQNNIGF